MTTLHIDLETFSAADLPKCGLDNYATDPTTGVHCMAFAFDDESPFLYAPTPGTGLNHKVVEHVRNGGEVVAHNAAFELAIWNKVCVPKYGWPILSPKQMRCTMAQAYAMSLPGALENAAKALGITQQKDMAGSRIMMQLAKPKADGSFWKPEDAPDKFKRLYDYCKQDVEVERELDRRMMQLSDKEQRVWVLDQIINQRGIRVDLPAIDNAIAMVEIEKARLDKEMLRVTGGAVGKCTEVQLLIKWIRTQGVELKGLAKADVLDALKIEDMPSVVRKALLLRQEAAKSSTAKLIAMKNRASRDGRVRGCFQYHGASTGRWAHRGIQPGNLPRPRKLTKDDDENVRLILHINELIARNQHQLLDMIYGPTMDAMADSIRGMIIASPGHELVAMDFSAIEARVLAWLAGEEKVLDIFRTHGKIYEHAASGIYRKDIREVTKAERQIGKVACFGPHTQVLTNNGIKSMIAVTQRDLLWDGVEWVQHEGVVCQGSKQVISVAGLEVTPDHLIRTNQTWTRARELASSESILRQALETGSENLPCLGSSGTSMARVIRTWFACNVPVRLRRIWSWITTCVKGEALGATYAPRGKRGIGAKIFGRMQTSFRTTATGADFSTASPRASTGATTPTTPDMSIMGAEACLYTSPGARIDGNFWPISSRSRVGISRLLNLTASMLMGATPPATFGLSAERKTRRTNAESAHSRSESRNWRPVYDVVNAGPRHRFTVMTSRGPLLVHNCLALGYGGGVGAFQSMARVYGVKVDDTLADEIKRAWRESHAKIVRYWYDLEKAAINAVELGVVCKAGPIGRQVVFKKSGSFLWCRLPSGRVLCYPYPSVKSITTPWGEDKSALHFWSVNGVTKKWEETKTYGGSLSENITQAVARDLLAEAMLRLHDAGYPVVMHVHDEVVTEIAEDIGDEVITEIEGIVSVVPDWATGLPLSAEGWRGFRYRK
jgi:DNA polymerase